MRVEVRERLHDDRHGQIDNQYARHYDNSNHHCLCVANRSRTCGHRTDQHAEHRFRIQISVANGRHGDHIEPYGIGNRAEHVLIGLSRCHPFGIVDQRCKDAHGDEHEEDQQPQDRRRVLHRSDDHLQAGMMVEQLE